VPTESAASAVVAMPLPFKVTAEPKLTPSTLNCTLPVGVAVLGDTSLTVAVKVTDWPKTDGLPEEVTAVVVAAWFTVWVIADEVLPVKL